VNDEFLFGFNEIPPSLNAYYRHARRKTYITPAGKLFKRRMHNLLFKLGNGSYVVPVEMEVTIIVPDKRAHDVDNFLKALLDSMENLVFVNDQLVVKLTVEKDYVKGVSRTEICVKPANRSKYKLFTSTSQLIKKK